MFWAKNHLLIKLKLWWIDSCIAVKQGLFHTNAIHQHQIWFANIYGKVKLIWQEVNIILYHLVKKILITVLDTDDFNKYFTSRQ